MGLLGFGVESQSSNVTYTYVLWQSRGFGGAYAAQCL